MRLSHDQQYHNPQSSSPSSYHQPKDPWNANLPCRCVGQAMQISQSRPSSASSQRQASVKPALCPMLMPQPVPVPVPLMPHHASPCKTKTCASCSASTAGLGGLARLPWRTAGTAGTAQSCGVAESQSCRVAASLKPLTDLAPGLSPPTRA